MRKLCPQLFPLLRKNFLVFSATRWFLLATLLSIFGGFLIALFFIIYPVSETDLTTLLDLFPTDSLNVGPSGLCNLDFFKGDRPPIALVMNEGVLGDQIHFNVQSLQNKLAFYGLERNSPIAEFLPDFNQNDTDFSPVVGKQGPALLVLLHWNEKSATPLSSLIQQSSPNTSGLINNNEYPDNNFNYGDDFSGHSTTSSPSSNHSTGQVHLQQQHQEQNQQQHHPQQQPEKMIYEFSYQLTSASASPRGWALDLFPYFVNPYDNTAFTIKNIDMAAYISALVELSIAQINGFYPNTPICDFPQASFDLNVYSYPTTFSKLNRFKDATLNENSFIYTIIFAAFFLPTSLFIISTSVTEKASHLHAALIAIGITPLNMHFALHVTYTIFVLPILFLVSIVTIGYFGIAPAFIMFWATFGIVLTIITFSLMLSTLFKNNLPLAQVASLSSLIIFFIFGVLCIHIQPLPRLISCVLFFPSAITHLFSGMHWLFTRLGDTFSLPDAFWAEVPGQPFSIFATVCLLYVQSILHFFLGVYLDSIIPSSSHHNPKHWSFPLVDSFRFLVRTFRCQGSCFARLAYSLGGSLSMPGLSVDSQGQERLNIMSLDSNGNDNEEQEARKPNKFGKLSKTGKARVDASTSTSSNGPDRTAARSTSRQKKRGKKKVGAATAVVAKPQNDLDSMNFDDFSDMNESHSGRTMEYQDMSSNDLGPRQQSQTSITFKTDSPSFAPASNPGFGKSLISSPDSISNKQSPGPSPSLLPAADPPHNPFLSLLPPTSPHYSTSTSSNSSHSTSAFSTSTSTSTNAFDHVDDQLVAHSRRYFLQFGRDRKDKLREEEEYLFEGRNPASQDQSIDKGADDDPFSFQQHTYSGHTAPRLSQPPPPQSTGFFDAFSSTLVATANFFESQIGGFSNTSINNDNQTDLGDTQLASLAEHSDSSYRQMPENSTNQAQNDFSKAGQTTSVRPDPIIQYPTQTEKDNPSITLKNLTKTFEQSFMGPDKVTALDGVNLRLYRGQIHSIIGKNASGKSVLLSILGGFMEQSDGSVFLHVPNPKSQESYSHDPYKTPLEEMMENPLTQYNTHKKMSKLKQQGKTDAELYRPTFGICWQEDTLFEDLTCFQNLELFSMFKEAVSGTHLTPQQRYQEISQFLDMAQLSAKFDGKEHSPVNSLSGGMRRKLNLAVSLLHNPQIVLLDHCTNGADVNAQAVIWAMLEAQKKKRTIILATHSLSEALIGDRISVLKEGQLVCSGSALFLKDHFKVGEYIFTIDKQPYLGLEAELFEHEALKKKMAGAGLPVQGDLPPGFDDLPAFPVDELNPNTTDPSQPDAGPTQSPATAGTGNNSNFLDDEEAIPTLTVDLHHELMNTPIEQIGFDIRSMLRLISDSHLNITYAILPQHESNIPLLLDYLEQNTDRLWIRATSLTTTSLDDVFRRAHNEDENGNPIIPSYGDDTDPTSSDQPTYPTPTTSTVTTTNLPNFPKPVATKAVYNPKQKAPKSGRLSPTSASIDGLSLDSLDDIDTSPTHLPGDDDFFTGKAWYQTELPRIEGSVQLFRNHFSAFFRKRAIMFFYHSVGIIPVALVIATILLSPIIIYSLIVKVATPISIDFNQFRHSNSRLQYLAPQPPAAPESFQLLQTASASQYSQLQPNSFSNASTSLRSSQLHAVGAAWRSSYADASAAYDANTNGFHDDELIDILSSNNDNDEQNHPSKLTFDSSESILDWFSRPLVSSSTTSPSKVEVPQDTFDQSIFSPGKTQTILHSQSQHGTRLKPSYLTTVVHSLAVKFNSNQYQLLGESLLPSSWTKSPHPQSQSPNHLAPSSADSLLTSFSSSSDAVQTQQINDASQFGVLSASSSIYANLTSPLTVPSYIARYYSHLASLHINIQSLLSLTKDELRNEVNEIHNNNNNMPNQQEPLLSSDNLTFGQLYPKQNLKPIYHNSPVLSYHQSLFIRFSTLLAGGINALFTLLPVVLGMFVIYHHAFERSSKIYELHRLASGNGMAAYHISNMCFDILICAVTIITTFVAITGASYITLRNSDEDLIYVSLSDHPIAYVYIGVYLLILSIATPFQAYISFYISPTSLTFSYIIHTLTSSLPLLIFWADSKGNSFYHFLAYLSPTSVFVISIFKRHFTLWHYDRNNDPAIELTKFHPALLTPLIFVVIGAIVVFFYHYRISTLGFNKLTGTLGSSFSGHRFNAIRPYNRITKQDSTVLDMKRRITMMRNRTGDQGQQQYSLTLCGLRKVYHNNPTVDLLRSFGELLNSIFNPFYHWWRADQRYSTKEQREVEKFKLKLLRRQRRLQRQRELAKNPHAVQSRHDAHDDDSDDDLDLNQLPFATSKSLRGATVALNELYLSIRKNSVFSISGTNGSGKSTLLSLLTNEAEPSSSNDPLCAHNGFIENTNLITDPAGVFSKISYCPQANRLNFQLSGRQHFELYATLYGIRPEIHDSLIQRVIHSLRLQDVADDPCHRYSPGQLRTVMIGISLLSNSEIVLLDEFSNFLDPISRSRVHRLLKSLLHTRTIVMASHMAEEIESLSDDIAIMSKGSLITVGSKAMLKAGDHHYNDRSSVQQDSLVYTVNIRVESVQVLMSVQSFVISTLARIPPPKLAQTTTTTTNPNLDLAALHKTESQQYIHMWHSWLKQCADGGVKLVDQRHNRFTLHVSTDLFPLSTLFTRLEGCKMQCGTHLLRYTASQPTVDQLFISVLERSNRITKNSDDKMDYGGSVVI